jgi:DNA-directed RNA polymerase I subunit RPA1
MNISLPVGSEIDSVSFSFYDAAEIRKISVKQIVNPIIMDTMGHPTKGGLYDPALGPYTKRHMYVLPLEVLIRLIVLDELTCNVI